ncbi:FixH family protein [Magnetospira thiophila]
MTRQRPDGWWYPWIFVFGMLIVVVVNGTLIYLATTTFGGLETEGHYEKGIAYNKTLALAKEQEAMGWTAEIGFTQTGGGSETANGTVLVRVMDRDGNEMPGLRIVAYFIRPTQDGFDQHVDLLPFSGGSYAAPVSLPLKGQWDVHIVAEGGAVPFQKVQRIMAK